MDIRRIWLCKDVVFAEGGLPAIKPVTRVAACAVITNPAADHGLDDLSELVGFGADLGARLVKEAQALMSAPAISYGKAAIVGRRAISSMPPQSCIRGWESRCARQSGAGRRSFRRT
jgi:hypothetical protein